MLTPLDDSPWHQLLTTLDHVGTSGVRFFDRLRFAASDRQDNGVFQFTIGVHQNMNVVDGGVVAIVDGRQHNLRVSRQLRPTYDVPCGPLSIEVIEPLRRIRLAIAQNDGSLESEVIWTATMDAHEERRRFNRSWGRMLENYSRYDQIGELSGSLRRSRAGDPNRKRCAPDGRDRRSLDRCGRCRDPNQFEAAFVDDCRPRRTTAAATASFIVTDVHGEVHHFVVERRGPAVAMHGLGYGGYDDGKGPGVYCGIAHGEGEVQDVSRPTEVAAGDGTIVRPVHRIQPVQVTLTGPTGTSAGNGSLTCIAEADLDVGSLLRIDTTLQPHGVPRCALGSAISENAPWSRVTIVADAVRSRCASNTDGWRGYASVSAHAMWTCVSMISASMISPS